MVAQLDRVAGYEPVGRGFKSSPSHQTLEVSMLPGFLFLENNPIYGKKVQRRCSRNAKSCYTMYVKTMKRKKYNMSVSKPNEL